MGMAEKCLLPCPRRYHRARHECAWLELYVTAKISSPAGVLHSRCIVALSNRPSTQNKVSRRRHAFVNDDRPRAAKAPFACRFSRGASISAHGIMLYRSGGWGVNLKRQKWPHGMTLMQRAPTIILENIDEAATSDTQSTARIWR